MSCSFPKKLFSIEDKCPISQLNFLCSTTLEQGINLYEVESPLQKDMESQGQKVQEQGTEKLLAANEFPSNSDIIEFKATSNAVCSGLRRK